VLIWSYIPAKLSLVSRKNQPTDHGNPDTANRSHLVWGIVIGGVPDTIAIHKPKVGSLAGLRGV
jgi:hypothetical protein